MFCLQPHGQSNQITHWHLFTCNPWWYVALQIQWQEEVCGGKKKKKKAIFQSKVILWVCLPMLSRHVQSKLSQS